jgi:hypothetical protein
MYVRPQKKTEHQHHGSDGQHQTLTSDQAGDDAKHVLNVVLCGSPLVAEGFHSFVLPNCSLFDLLLSTMAHATRTSTMSVKSPPKKKEAVSVKAKNPVFKKTSSPAPWKAGVVISIEACKQ